VTGWWLVALALASDPGEPLRACRDPLREGRYAEADAPCRACATMDDFCRGRVEWLDQRRDGDGGFDALAKLEAARRGEAGPEAVLAVRDDAGAPWTVRAEAAVWLADRAWRERDAEGAVSALDPVWPPPEGAPEAVSRRVVELRARGLAGMGRDEEARATEAAIRVGPGDRLSPAEEVARERSRSTGTRLAAGLLAAFALVTAPLGARALASGLRPLPLGLLPLILLLGGTWAIADAWEDGAGRMIPPLAAGLVAVHVLTLYAQVSAPAWRRVLGLSGAVASLAVAWLALWYTDSLDLVGR
jgi:hypothetical protein